MEKKVVVLTSTEYNNTIPLIQVVKKMVDNNMIPIFGVTKNVENLYKDLAGKKHIFSHTQNLLKSSSSHKMPFTAVVK